MTGRTRAQWDDEIELPADMCIPDGNIHALIDHIWGDEADRHTDLQWIAGRAILCPRNVDVDAINFAVASSFPGPAYTYNSADSVGPNDEVMDYPVEYLNTLRPSGMPPHRLHPTQGRDAHHAPPQP